MKNSVLFIGATHGNEPIGVCALQSLEKQRQDFDWIIGNPCAFEKGERCFEGDLNRSAPGDLAAQNYASRRAAEILEKTQSYRYTIDLHGTSKQTGLFAIITRSSPENIALAKRFDVRRVVIWPSFSEELAGPLSEFFPCGLEIECGPKEDIQTQKELERVLDRFLDEKDSGDVMYEQEWFEVYGSLREDPKKMLNEFVETEVNRERFFPLLVGSYQDSNGIVCYKMRRFESHG